uniref:Uncharacterized protein n=1 Tax=Glossina pallidipes TaxID=7398 RepID=A0A1A9ZAK9_GLOPL
MRLIVMCVRNMAGGFKMQILGHLISIGFDLTPITFNNVYTKHVNIALILNNLLKAKRLWGENDKAYETDLLTITYNSYTGKFKHVIDFSATDNKHERVLLHVHMSRHRSNEANSAAPPESVLGPVLYDLLVNTLTQVVQVKGNIYFGDDIFNSLSSSQWTADSFKARTNKCLVEFII